jgi:disulfide bond formation protein DsbB
MKQRTACLLAIAVITAGSVGAALWAQHGLGMQPCPWCILQRLILCVIALLALLAALLPPLGQRLTALPIGLLALCGGAAALYQNLVAAKSASCNLTLADRIVSGLSVDAWWPEVFEVRASCADAAVSILGVPFEIWGLLLFVGVATTATWATWRPSR